MSTRPTRTKKRPSKYDNNIDSDEEERIKKAKPLPPVDHLPSCSPSLPSRSPSPPPTPPPKPIVKEAGAVTQPPGAPALSPFLAAKLAELHQGSARKGQRYKIEPNERVPTDQVLDHGGEWTYLYRPGNSEKSTNGKPYYYEVEILGNLLWMHEGYQYPLEKKHKMEKWLDVDPYIDLEKRITRMNGRGFYEVDISTMMGDPPEHPE